MTLDQQRRQGKTPFTPDIVGARLPDNWKNLALEKYDGTTDPEEHLDAFVTQVSLYTDDDAIMFCHEPSSSAHLNRTGQHSPREEGTSKNLHGKVRTNDIRDLDPVVAMHHLTTALKPDPFVNSLCKKPPQDLDDLRHRATKYMQMEELAAFRSQNRPDLFYEKKESDKEPPRSRPRDVPDREKNNRGPRYMHYTPLNTSRAKVLEQALATEVLAVPRRAMTLPHADKIKACHHRNRGHTTEECSAF
ncbi:uncharacterized protein LOC109818538 [Cajanus cajan]|uniref:uncharacterized protein LOC109818538 n=1 Tax=Cajanus cajan TaxID=3821 RepID=UPI00098DAF31|nr:uncharacterized protein LOC109818538 [Cajanus cajan]